MAKEPPEGCVVTGSWRKSALKSLEVCNAGKEGEGRVGNTKKVSIGKWNVSFSIASREGRKETLVNKDNPEDVLGISIQ